MEKFVTVIIFIFIFTYLLGRLLPYILRWWLKRKIGRYQGPVHGDDEDIVMESRKNEGKVIISKDNCGTEKLVDREVGDYIEYEEKKSDE